LSRRIVSGIILLLLLVSLSDFRYGIQLVKPDPTTITVPEDYLTIQEAINAASDGDIIEVHGGYYSESVIVNKSVSLIAIRFSQLYSLHVVVNNVSVIGFWFSSGGWFPYGPAIKLDGVSFCNISEVRVLGIDEGPGVVLEESSNNVIINSDIQGNPVWFGCLVFDSSHNNTILGNTILASYASSIYLEDSSGNRIFHNNFHVDGSRQVTVHGNCTNNWDNGYRSGGNYWSDHTCTGNPSNGSQPYTIDVNNIDHYPFQKPDGWIRVHNIDTDLDYITIQEAIDDPETLDGHTLHVDAGIFYEEVAVHKSISLVGEDEETTVLDGNGTSVTILNVTASHVTIRGFTIQNDSAIYGFEGGGIYIINSNNANIVDNVIKNTQYGINLRNSTSNIIKGNTVMGNDVGIQFIEDSTNNAIYHNNFINNNLQTHNIEDASNNWDKDCEGNYWSDYNGTDSDGDGIGDTPYIIDENNIDRYPLMNLYWNPCDINHDLTVDMRDVGRAARAFDTQEGDLDWNPHVDITGFEHLVPDGTVDMRDIALIARNFGEEYQL